MAKHRWAYTAKSFIDGKHVSTKYYDSNFTSLSELAECCEGLGYKWFYPETKPTSRNFLVWSGEHMEIQVWPHRLY